MTYEFLLRKFKETSRLFTYICILIFKLLALLINKVSQ